MDIRYFTPGPVQMDEDICAIGGTQVPYFRNQTFSDVTLDCEAMLLELARAPEGSKVVLLTCSGTGGMEAAIANFATQDRDNLIINSRGFGQRLVDICSALGRPVTEFQLPMAQALTTDDIGQLPSSDWSTLFVNAHDTVSGVHHDIQALGNIAKTKDALFVVDAISSFLCDPINMAAQNIDVLIIGSQKALALPPGLAVLILSPKAVEFVRAPGHACGSYYFDLMPALSNAERGQTPFTPAVSIIYQLQARLKGLTTQGIDDVVAGVQRRSAHFRQQIAMADLPFEVFPDIASSAITALRCTDPSINVSEMVREIDARYGVYLTPNGGVLAKSVFRISHMGVQTVEALDQLVELLKKYYSEREV